MQERYCFWIVFNYFNSRQGLKILSVAWRAITPEEFEIIKKQVRFPQSVKSHEDLQRHLTQEEIDSNSLLEVVYLLPDVCYFQERFY
jgi:DNA-binding response OmpR family regulator